MSTKPEPPAGCDLTEEEVTLLDRIVTPWLIPHESRIPSDIERLYTYGLIALAERRKILGRAKPMTPQAEDVIVWPDGHWCYAEELDQFSHKSDDYERIAYGTGAWKAITWNEDAELKAEVKTEMKSISVKNDHLAVWPDGSWCFLGDLSQYKERLDTYVIVNYNSGPWNLIMSLYRRLSS